MYSLFYLKISYKGDERLGELVDVTVELPENVKFIKASHKISSSLSTDTSLVFKGIILKSHKSKIVAIKVGSCVHITKRWEEDAIANNDEDVHVWMILR